MTKLFAYAAALSLCSCCSNLASRTARPVGHLAAATQSSQSYAAVLTWTNYDRWNDPDEAVYLLNGKPTGTGDAGLRAALARLHELPAGARLLIYPAGYVRFRKWPGFYGYLPPFWKRYREVGDSIRHLNLTIQDEDELGRPVNTLLPATRPSRTTRP